jgi:Na+/glutamate symporter
MTDQPDTTQDEQSEKPPQPLPVAPPASIAKLSSTISMAYRNMTPEQQSVFEEEYKRTSRSMVAMMLLAFLFPIQLFFLKKTGLGVAFLLTGFFVGLGYFVMLVITPKMVKEYNADRANEAIRNIRYASGQ